MYKNKTAKTNSNIIMFENLRTFENSTSENTFETQNVTHLHLNQ